MSKKFNNNIFTKGTVIYSDFDISFNSSPITNDLIIKSDVDSIEQSLKNIIFTNKNERPCQPNLHGGINELLFEQIDEVVSGVLEDQLRYVIQNYEPRIELISVTVSEVQEDSNSVSIKIRYNMDNYLQPRDINMLIERKR